MTFATFAAGPYTATYNTDNAPGSPAGKGEGPRDLGLVEGIRRWKRVALAVPVGGSAFGATTIDGVYAGGECFCEMTFKEWSAAVRDCLWPFDDTFGNSGAIGQLLTDLAGELILAFERYANSHILMAVQPYHDHFVYVHHNGPFASHDPPWSQWEVPRSETFPNILRVGDIGTLGNTIWGAARGPRNRTWVYQPTDVPQLIAVNSEGQRLKTLPVDPSLIDEATLRARHVPIQAMNDSVMFALDNRLLTFVGDQLKVVEEFNERILSITCSAPNTLPRIAVGLETGGEVMWSTRPGESGDRHRVRFGEELEAPIIGINRGGYLIAVTANRCQVYRTAQRKVTFVGEVTPQTQGFPLAILSAPQANWFGIAGPGGNVDVYKVD